MLAIVTFVVIFIIKHQAQSLVVFPCGTRGKESACQCRRYCKRQGFGPWPGRVPWRRAWQPAPVFLPRESMDRGARRATVPGVAKPQTQPKCLARTHSTWCQKKLSESYWEFWFLKNKSIHLHTCPKDQCRCVCVIINRNNSLFVKSSTAFY